MVRLVAVFASLFIHKSRLRSNRNGTKNGHFHNLFAAFYSFALKMTMRLKETINKSESSLRLALLARQITQNKHMMIIVRGLFLHVNYIKYFSFVQLPHRRVREKKKNVKTLAIQKGAKKKYVKNLFRHRARFEH